MICINNDIKLIKTCLVKQCIVGDIISFIINIKNNGKKNIYDVTINDRLASNLSFIKGSISVDLKEFRDENIVSGINIGEIEVGCSKIIKFNAKVIENRGTGNGSIAFCNYTYLSDDNKNINMNLIRSNKEELEVFYSNIDIIRSSNKNNIFIGENIKIFNTLKNTGELKIDNVLFKDIIPDNSILVDGTFCIDGKKVNSIEIRKGVKIQSINVGESVNISYELKVLDKNIKSKLVSQAIVEGYCRLPCGIDKKLELKKSSIDINIAISNFKSININGVYDIQNIKPNILEINRVNCEVSIRNSSIITTIKSVSIEGQKSTGYKMVVIANIDTIMSYIAEGSLARVYSENYNSIFSTYIMLPPDFRVGSRIEVYPIVENTNFELIDNRSFFYEVSILLILKIYNDS